MSGLSTPLNYIQSIQNQSIDKLKDDSLSHMEKSYFAPNQQKKIQENAFKEKEFEKPQGIFLLFFCTSLIFQFIGSMIVCTDILLNFLNIGSNTNKILYFKIGYVLASTIAYSTYTYISFEVSQWQPLNITKSIRLSFLFTIITFLLGLYIFTETKQQEWVCEQSSKGLDCFSSNTKIYPSNYLEKTCKIKLSPPDCYAILFSIIIKYGILICCGIPLFFTIIALIKYILVARERERKLKECEISQDSSSQKMLKTVELNSNLNGYSNQQSPHEGQYQTVQDQSNFFSNKQKIIYKADANTSNYVYSNKDMFNPNQQIDFQSQKEQEPNPNDIIEGINNPSFKINNNEL